MGSINIPIIESQGEKSDREYMLYLANMLAIMRDQLVNVMEGRLSTNNIRELIADKIKTGTLDAGLVTIRADYPGGAYIVLDSNGMVINDGTENVFEADTSGNLVLQGIIYALGGLIGGWTIGADKLSGSGVIEGGTIRTAAPGNQRVEMSNGSIKGYTDDNLLSGLVFDPNKASDIVDLFLYHRGTKLVEFFDNITAYKIRGATPATSFSLGGNGVTTFAEGTWTFTGSVSGIPQSAIDNLVSRLNSIENDIEDLDDRVTALEGP